MAADARVDLDRPQADVVAVERGRGRGSEWPFRVVGSALSNTRHAWLAPLDARRTAPLDLLVGAGDDELKRRASPPRPASSPPANDDRFRGHRSPPTARRLQRTNKVLVGVVLLAREQTPEQAGELARGRDDRDRVAAAGADPLVE